MTNHATSFLDVHRISVEGTSSLGFLVQLADLQDVIKTVKRNLWNQVTVSLDRLFWTAARSLVLTWMILLSIDFKRSHKGLITPWLTMYRI
jgi:hypothetical protein